MEQTIELTIDHMILHQLLGDEAFYDALPASLERLRKPGCEAHRAVVEQMIAGKPCLGCSPIKARLLPLQNDLGNSLTAIQAMDPEALRPLRTYLEHKRGYPLQAVMMYYKGESGRLARLSF